MTSAWASVIPFVSTNYLRTYAHGILSSLSTELQMVLNLSISQFAYLIIIYNIFLWLTFTKN